MRFPPQLSPGDDVAVVAPASSFDRQEFFRGLAWLRGRYKISVRGNIFEKKGYLAGGDDRRADELAAAMVHPTVKAIVAARGGYGIGRIVHQLPWREFVERPKWLVGFSDVTALHVTAQAHSLATIHGPHVTGLGREADAWCRASFLRALEGSLVPQVWEGLTVLHPGASCQGRAFGGNLALVEAMAAAGQLRVPRDAVVFLEDVTERPYRIDRMLTSLLQGGHLQNARAIVFGGFTRCDPGPDGVSVEEVLLERTASLGVPVLAGAPFGHEPRNDAFVLGADVSVEPGKVTFLPATA
jgi:muramoyltetrapeptide carboxypeptidase